MYKLQVLVGLLLIISSGRLHANADYVDTLLQRIAVEENLDRRFDLIFDLFSPDFESDPYLIISTGNELLDIGEEKDDQMSLAAGNSLLGHGYRLIGNSTKGLIYHHEAIKLAEKLRHESLLGFVDNQLANIYKDRNDLRKAVELYKEAFGHAEKGKNERLKVWPLMNMGATYLNAGMPDSARILLQLAYSQCVLLKYDYLSSYLLTNLGAVESKLGNDALAVSYLHMAMKEAQNTQSQRYINMVCTALSEHYCGRNIADSCTFYARKAIAAVDKTVFFYLSQKPAWMLTVYYDQKSCDSTLKYARLYKTSNDSLNNAKAIQQIQVLTLEEELRQKEAIEEMEKEQEIRRQNIQYAGLALGIVILISLWLLLSRTIATTPKLIHFFSVIALLLVFEFLNLVLHPFLGKITHHTPSLMLLGLVCIGALLIPLHHRLEKIAIEKLTRKNAEIRLARAKKTIEELENNEK
jgi:tetratricopeptide (TPR) repeat protein